MKMTGSFYVLGTPNYHSLVPSERYDSSGDARKAADKGLWLNNPNIVCHISESSELLIIKVGFCTTDLEAFTSVVTGTGWPTEKIKVTTKIAGFVDVSHLATTCRKIAER